MRLQDWMRQERYTDAAFIELVNHALLRDGHPAYDWRSVRPWRIGKVVPRPVVVVAIAEVTKGAVTYTDHVAENAPHRKRGGLKVS
jgi:hypothetical protein